MTETRQPVSTMRDRDTLLDLIRSLRWARLGLTLTAEEPLHLPPYKGSTFRGAFGHAFKRVACPLRRECDGCPHTAVCVYAYVFETAGASDGSPLTRGAAVAHPFVLEPPDMAQRDFEAGARLELDLVLIGRAIPLAPYFLAACREMGSRGVGQGRGRFRVEQAIAADPEDARGRIVYDSARDLLAPAVPFWSGAEMMTRGRRGAGETGRGGDTETGSRTVDSSRQLAGNSKSGTEGQGNGKDDETCVTLEFLTPTRIRQDADLVVKPNFLTLATALLRRVSVLAEAHCGGKATLDARSLLDMAKAVQVAKSELRWHDWERYSARQDARMTLGGFVGRITFAGPLAPWLPLLRVGEVLHVGKGTAFGLGMYRMEAP